ncbi:hybrid sensor histidine kinase/response regulator [Flavobacterium salmonis]|uniref:histidine kinase n=2 Tax=Flavobacterium salmonis TaxID=2654844 RepID=A0A6V6Z103_9FLAO|nr:hybrid sensor histidine kinase/response regulator [Flavobacterium salmonis]
MPQMRIFLYLLFLNCFCNPVIAHSKKISDSKIDELIKQACLYLNKSNFEKSLINSRVALNYAFLKKDDFLIADCYRIIADNYNELSEFDKAIFFYNKSLFYANRTTADSIKYSIYNNLGNIYCFEKKQLDEGIRYYKKSIAYGLKINDFKQVYFINVNIAWVYFDIGRFDEGAPFLKFINLYEKRDGDESVAIVVNMLNGMFYSHKMDYKKADAYFKKSIDSGKNTEEQGEKQSDLSYAYLEYSHFLIKIRKYKEAYENLSNYNRITDKLYGQEKLKKASVAGFNLELDEYKREIDKIENEKVTQSQSLKKSRIIVVLFIIISFVLLILIFTLYKNIVIKKKANEELLKANEIAEEASLLKTQFISTISHELRTPLYGVVGVTNMLLEEHKELSGSPYLSSLKFSARYLLALVNDILQINKIEENRVVLENSTFDLSEEIDMIKSSLSFLSKKNNNQILVNIDSEIPRYLIGDKLRFGQILMNLVGNALKFTKNGKVTIKAKLLKIEEDNHFIEFKVKDNGIGIALADQSKIFEKFVQVGRKEEDYQGTGLGLSIVKKLLNLFGSTISLKSALGKGTTFTFTIPFKKNPEKNKAAVGKFDFEFNSQFKVLIVDDNFVNQLVTKKIIERNNYKCSVADDGFAAIDLLKKEEFDVVLMDINMPLMNGFETTRRLRSSGNVTPIVALTAFDKDEIADEAISSGMNDIIVKPFEPDKLFRIINNLILEEKSVGY